MKNDANDSGERAEQKPCICGGLRGYYPECDANDDYTGCELYCDCEAGQRLKEREAAP